MQHKQKIYLAGGLRSNWQQNIISTCGDRFIFFNPREHELEFSHEQYSLWDMHHVKQCDILFAYIEADNPSGYGMTLEIGYAKGLGKTIILVDERSQNDSKFLNYFHIVRNSVDIVFDNIEDATHFLKAFKF